MIELNYLKPKSRLKIKDLNMKQVFIVNFIAFILLGLYDVQNYLNGTTKVIIELTNLLIALISLRAIIRNQKKKKNGS